MSKIAFKLVVYGKVQGIGYRWFVREIAKEEKISGYVKNNYDGTVEIIAEAENKEKITVFIERIKREHPYAIVEKIDISEVPLNNYKDFDIRY